MFSLNYTLFAKRTHKDHPGVNHHFMPSHEGKPADSLTDEEKLLAASNPFGSVEIHINDPAIQSQLEEGKTYRIDITEI